LHLAQVLLTLLPGTLPVVFTTAEIDLSLAPGLLFTLPPLISLLIGPALVSVVVVSGPTIVRRVSLIVLIALPLPIAALIVILPALELTLPFGRTPLLKQALLLLGSSLVVIPAALEVVLAFLLCPSFLVELPAVFLLSRPQLFLVVSLLFSSLLLCQASLLVGLPSLLVLILARLFRLPSLYLFLTLLLPLPSLLSALLLLTLPFSLALFVTLATLLLRLTFVVAALLFGLTPLGFVVAPVVILILVPFPLFAANATVLTIVGLLCAGQAGGCRQSGQGEG
jgi:hypothetical protein